MADANRLEITIGASLDPSLEASTKDVADQFDALQAIAVPALSDIGGGFQGINRSIAQSLASLEKWNAVLGQKADAKPKAPDTSNGDDKGAERARRSAEQITQIWSETQQKRIQGEQAANSSLLALGQESLAQFEAQALKLEDERYQIQEQGLARRKAADAGNAQAIARDQAQGDLLAQEHLDRRAQLEEQYAARISQANQQETREFISSQQEQLSAAISSTDQEFRAHELSASERAAAEQKVTAATQAAIDERLNAEMAGLNVESKAYQVLSAERERSDAQFARRHAEIMNQLVQEDTQQWNSLLAPFNSTLNQMLSGHTKWSAMIAGLERQLIMKLIETGEKDAIAWIVKEQTKTLATNAGNAERTASTAAAAQAGAASEGGWMKQSALGHAYSAAAATFDSVAQIPYVGYILAPAAAAATLAAVLALGGNIPSFASGAWELPHDTLAQVHKGEMIVPAAQATQMRAGFAVPGASSISNSNATHHQWNYAPTIQGVPERNVVDELRNNSAEFMSFIRGLGRGGSLKFA